MKSYAKYKKEKCKMYQLKFIYSLFMPLPPLEGPSMSLCPSICDVVSVISMMCMMVFYHTFVSSAS